jgi:hypothetical protein
MRRENESACRRALSPLWERAAMSFSLCRRVRGRRRRASPVPVVELPSSPLPRAGEGARNTAARNGTHVMKRYVKGLLARDVHHVLRRSDLAVGLAMLQAAKKSKPRLSAVEFAARFAIEKALLQCLCVVADLPSQGVPPQGRLPRRCKCLFAARRRDCAASCAGARAARHSRSDAGEYRRAGTCGAPMHAARIMHGGTD